MAGNVWEWTLSLWGQDENKPQYGYPYNPVDGRENLPAANDIRRVVRGGSCTSGGRIVRCAFRLRDYPHHCSGNIGFRLVLLSAAS
jgi:iron(II)-dependent oxidoreductase